MFKNGGWFAPLFLNSRSYSKLDEKPIVKAAVFLIAKNFALDFSIRRKNYGKTYK